MTTLADLHMTIVDTAHTHHWQVNHTRRSREPGQRYPAACSQPAWPTLELWHPRAGIHYAYLTAAGTTPAQQQLAESLRTAGGTVHSWTPLDWPHIAAFLAAADHERRAPQRRDEDAVAGWARR
jgi:hypothetical protein